MTSSRVCRGRVPSVRASLLALLAGAALLAAPEPAAAQPGEARVRALTREATEAYTNLDLERAESLLVRAVAEARRRRVRGRVLAEVHVVRGVLAVAGHNDLERGAEAFDEALQADPTVEVDRMISNPQIDAVFRAVQRRRGITPAGGHRIPHEPVAEQLENVPIPIYVEMPDGITASRAVVRYWPVGSEETYDETELDAVGAGFGVELPCAASSRSGIEYYVVVFGEDGEIAAQAGSEDEPFAVSIVASRTTDAPSLPNRPPPQACDDDCPDGEGCRDDDRIAEGGACDTDAQCAGGLACIEDVCAEPGSGGPEGPRFFVRIGYAAGTGYAREGGRADTQVPSGADPNAPEYQGYIDAMDDPIACDAPPGEYCVRVQTEGLVFVHGGDVQFGVNLVPRLAVWAGARVAASAGEGTLSRFLITGGVELHIVQPVGAGFHLSASGGAGIGQIQLRVPQGASNIKEPFIITGLGNFNLGLPVGYRFTDSVGIYLRPTLHGFFPQRTFVVEGVLGAEVSF